MRRTWIALQCDDCGALFPMHPNGTVKPEDAAIYTSAMLRTEASRTGWQRYGGQDYCTACEKDHRNAAARAAVQKGGK